MSQIIIFMLIWHAIFVRHYGAPSPDFVNLNPNFIFLRTYLLLLVLSETQRSVLMSEFVNYVAETEYTDFSNNRQNPTLAFCVHCSLCVFAHLHPRPQNDIGQGLVLATLLAAVYVTCGFCSFTSYSCDRKCHWYMIWAAYLTYSSVPLPVTC